MREFKIPLESDTIALQFRDGSIARIVDVVIYKEESVFIIKLKKYREYGGLTSNFLARFFEVAYSRGSDDAKVWVEKELSYVELKKLPDWYNMSQKAAQKKAVSEKMEYEMLNPDFTKGSRILDNMEAYREYLNYDESKEEVW